MSDREKQEREQQARLDRKGRPILYALGTAVAVLAGAVLLGAAAPDVFAALGGWLTVLGVLLLVSVWAGLTVVRRLNRGAIRVDDGPGSAR